MSAPNACAKCDGAGIAWVDDVLEPCDACALACGTCPECVGRGIVWDDYDEVELCPRCDGTGRAIRVSPMAVETDGEGRDEE